MDSLTDIWKFAPATWDTPLRNECYENNIFEVDRETMEYQTVEKDVKKAIKNLKQVNSICRVQNIFHYGQFLMRGQILARADSAASYYKVRRYVVIPTSLKDIAVKYNLDHRRLNMGKIEFLSHFPYVENNESIFVVNILTKDINDRCIQPYNFTEYYIDYIVDIVIF